jgi:3-hydroxyisobutyrate dehydrogenase
VFGRSAGRDDDDNSGTRFFHASSDRHDAMNASARRVGFIGFGNMGGRMGRRLLEAGVDLVAYDVDAAKVRATGATLAQSVGELADAVSLILLSLPDSGVVEAVVRGPGGVLEHARAGQVVVDLSTSNPTSTVALCRELATRDVALLDAGISGGAAAADRGTLTLMVGGSEAVLEDVRGVLELFASNIYFMGASGNGHTTKILNNFLNGISLAATAEMMVAARKADLDLARVLEVVNHSSGVNYATVNRFPHIIEGDYLEGGLTGELMAKDVALYVDLAEELRIASMLGPSCLLAFRVANALGYGDKISNRVVDALGDLSGGVRLAKES